MDWEKILNEAAKIQKIIKPLKNALEKKQNRFSEITKPIFAACIEIFYDVVSKYNSIQRKWIIVIGDDAEILLTSEKREISITCSLADPDNGREPVQEITAADARELSLTLRKLINEELKKNNIPLSFGMVGLPINYFSIPPAGENSGENIISPN